MDLIFADLNSNNKKIDKSQLIDKEVSIIIGDEGDFSEDDREEILYRNRGKYMRINDNV